MMKNIAISIKLGVNKQVYNISRFQTSIWIFKWSICDLSPDPTNCICKYTKYALIGSKITNTETHQEVMKVHHSFIIDGINECYIQNITKSSLKTNTSASRPYIQEQPLETYGSNMSISSPTCSYFKLDSIKFATFVSSDISPDLSILQNRRHIFKLMSYG